jgi:predicted Zn-dependent protease
VRICRYLFILASLTVAVGCESTRVAPIDTKHGSLALDGDERKMWDEARHVERRIEEAGLVYSNAELEAYIETVIVRLVSDRLEHPETEFKVRVLCVPDRNAFVFPNGVVYITTGMLACMDNEAELATVLGHETTHFLRRHQLKQTRIEDNKRKWVTVLGGTTMLVGLGPIVDEIGSSWATSAILGYSRDLENEADEQGLEELVRAGYDPSVSVRVFEYLREEDQLESAVYRTKDETHPQDQDRIDHYRELLKTRHADVSQQPSRIINREEYLAQIRQLLLDNAQLDLKVKRPEFAEKSIEKYIALWPDYPRGYFACGELYRHRQTAESRARAEAAYQEAARRDPNYPEPHRELGLLYRAEGRLGDACEELTIYLVLRPQAADSRTIQRYVDELDAELTHVSAP